VIHIPKPNDLDSRFTEVFDALLRWRRDDIICTGLRLKTQAYLTTAYGLGIDEPDCAPRILRWVHSPGCSVTFASAVAVVPTFTVRVGPKFTIDFMGTHVTLTEDAEP
jgi:hypothetical protein